MLKGNHLIKVKPWSGVFSESKAFHYGFCALASVILNIIAGPALCTPEEGRFYFTAAVRPAHVINFPQAYSLGILTLRPATPSVAGGNLQAAARGKIAVPASYCVFLDVGYHFLAHPQIIKTLPPDALESICITASSLAENEDGKVDKALAQIVHLQGLKEVLVDKSDATDVGIANLAKLPDLQRLSLYASNCNGDSFKELATLKSLRTLRASRTNLNLVNLKYLPDMRNLEDLSLARCQLDDAGLAHIGHCSKLILLDIGSNSKVSDAGVKYLKGLKKLQYLWIAQTHITWRGLKELTGLPLAHLYLGDDQLSPIELISLKKEFPAIHVEIMHRVKHIDSDTGSIFAPMH